MPANIVRPYVEFEGVKFFLEQSGFYEGYYRSSRSKGAKFLHCAVWVAKRGAIPKGYDIHHKDDNKATTDARKLECFTRKEHRSRHGVSGAFAESFDVRSNRRKDEWKTR